jgi:SAM-dependent methyltransferase
VLNVLPQPSTEKDESAARLLENGRLYDFVQRILGYRVAARRLQAAVGETSGRFVLDVGGGTGNLIPFLSPGTRYVCLDNDPGKIRRLLAVRPGTDAIAGDATRLPLRDKSIDVAVCVAVTHHLSDEQLVLLVEELSRVTRDRVVVFDPLRARSWRGRLLWKIDRGSFARSEAELVAFLTKGLAPEHLERLAIHHHYLLFVGRPNVIETGSADAPAR